MTSESNVTRKSVFSTRYMAEAAIIAAIYVVLVLIWPFSSGVVQVRLAEALSVLPFFTPAAVAGVTIGCLIANLVTGLAWQDVVFGTLASFIGVLFGYIISRYFKNGALNRKGDTSDSLSSIEKKLMGIPVGMLLTPIPTVLSNMLIIPPVIRFAYADATPIWFLIITVGAGEIISAEILGVMLGIAMNKRRNIVLSK